MRLSGPDTLEILAGISSRSAFEPHRQHPASIVDINGCIVDRVTVVFHPGPRSYTGEDLAEIGCHGNPILVDRILGRIASTGLARLAAPGEFTMRAFLNGKMDLIQAEAVGALIDATTVAGCDMAGSLLEGGLSERIRRLSGTISGILADIEASFISDEGGIEAEEVSARIQGPISELRGLAEGAGRAARAYGGVRTTVAGLPNVGKSSLFNAIVGSDRAIVHHEAGTTRDVLKERVLIDGVDFIFHDTAGIRTAPPGPEQAGVQRAIEAIEASDLLLYVVDARTGVQTHERAWMNRAGMTVVVKNKIDLAAGPVDGDPEHESVCVSAKFGTGIGDLKSLMARSFGVSRQAVFMDRHASMLRMAAERLECCSSALEQGMTLDVAAFDIHSALRLLDEATGGTAGEDVLDRVFSRFCIGK